MHTCVKKNYKKLDNKEICLYYRSNMRRIEGSFSVEGRVSGDRSTSRVPSLFRNFRPHKLLIPTETEVLSMQHNIQKSGASASEASSTVQNYITSLREHNRFEVSRDSLMAEEVRLKKVLDGIRSNGKPSPATLVYKGEFEGKLKITKGLRKQSWLDAMLSDTNLPASERGHRPVSDVMAMLYRLKIPQFFGLA